jgi:Ulp1 family protease
MEFEIKRCLSMGLKASTEYLFVPMLSGPGHWTLLYIDLQDLKWHHYNSLKGTATSRKAHRAAAEKFKKFLTSVLKPMIAEFRGVGVRKVTISQNLIQDEGAFQKNA